MSMFLWNSAAINALARCLQATDILLQPQELDAMFELVDAQARSGAADED
jgi:hypothetical protein